VVFQACYPKLQEAKIGRIAVRGQSRQKKVQRSHLKRKKLGMVACACHPSYGRKHKTRRIVVPGLLGKTMKPYVKNNQSKREVWFKN
jgi:hypothetical protein